jgi:hypothetical protein
MFGGYLLNENEVELEIKVLRNQRKCWAVAMTE